MKDKEKQTGLSKILDKTSAKTPLIKELELDMTSEMKDQFTGFITSKKTEHMFNLFITDIYSKYGDKYMIVIKANKKMQQYVISIIELKDVESFVLKENSIVKSYTATQLSDIAKDFIK